ncbi:MAG: hypothetical protein ABIF10_07780, partial [Candidatus Woesearchaeota archaeon]
MEVCLMKKTLFIIVLLALPAVYAADCCTLCVGDDCETYDFTGMPNAQSVCDCLCFQDYFTYNNFYQADSCETEEVP